MNRDENVYNKSVSDDNEEQDLLDDEEIEERVKRKKPGIVYLSTIPQQMNVHLLREALSVHGKIGRIFLQPDDNNGKKKKGNRKFTEGWVEFESKRVAKHVAKTLNNTRVSDKKRSPNYDVLWNIKYLSGFKWAHLNERLAYEKAVHQQRMRTEIAQVKRETNYFIQSIEKSKKLKRKLDTLKERKISQKPIDEDVKKRKTTDKQDRMVFLQNLFNKDTSE